MAKPVRTFLLSCLVCTLVLATTRIFRETQRLGALLLDIGDLEEKIPVGEDSKKRLSHGTGQESRHNLTKISMKFIEPTTTPLPKSIVDTQSPEVNRDVNSHNHSVPQPIAATDNNRTSSQLSTKSPRELPTTAQLNKRNMQQDYFNVFDAWDEYGQFGYVADPTLLRRRVQTFWSSRRNNSTANTKDENYYNVSHTKAYFDLVEHCEAQYRIGMTENLSLGLQRTCEDPGGDGIEGAQGLKLLKEKIRIAPPSSSTYNRPKLLCIIYTYHGYRDLARSMALSWGYKCDGFLAFSTETIPSLGFVDIVHPGKEHYDNMWQKVRAIWGYVGKHYLHDYDYFHIGGDDMYLIVENMRYFLEHQMEPISQAGKPILTGSFNIRNKVPMFVAGGPGYTMNRAGLQEFYQRGIQRAQCFPRKVVSFEDRMVTSCLVDRLRIELTDSRDPVTGEQIYHNYLPQSIYKSTPRTRGMIGFSKKMWRDAMHPTMANQTVGEKNGLDAAGKFSVSFHYMKSSDTVTRFTAILYRLCSNNTPLGRSLA